MAYLESLFESRYALQVADTGMAIGAIERGGFSWFASLAKVGTI
ncbi:hypothetical protein [Arthrobacter psychrolactophilus]